MGRAVKELFSDVAKALSWLADVVWSGFRQLVATGTAANNVKSARLFPISKAYWRYATTGVEIYLGDYKCSSTISGAIEGDLLAATSSAGESKSVAIPWPTNDWRRNAPYTSVYLKLPFYGLLHLPSSEIISDSLIIIETTLTQSGIVIFRLYGSPASGSSNVHSLGEYSVQVSSDFFIGSSNTSGLAWLSGGSAAVGATAATIGASTVTGGLAAATAGLVGTINAVQPISNGGGSGGGVLPLAQEYNCYTIFHDTSVAPDSVAAVMGTPTMAVKRINTLSGYVQTMGASVNVSADGPIRQRINQLLDGGIFYE